MIASYQIDHSLPCITDGKNIMAVFKVLPPEVLLFEVLLSERLFVHALAY